MYTPPYHPRALGPGALPTRRSRSRIRSSHVVWCICFSLCAALLLFYGWHISSLDVGAFRSTSREDDYSSSSSSSSGSNGGRGRRSRGLRSADDELGEELAPPVDGSGDVGRYWEAPVMVSYAYMEKDMVQRGNLEYFLQSGWVAPPPPAPGARPPHVTWVFTVAGEQCTPCGVAFPVTSDMPADESIGVHRALRVEMPPEEAEQHRRQQQQHGGPSGPVTSAPAPSPGWVPGQLSLVLYRTQNVGMDLASHNASLEYVRRHAGGIGRYKYFIVLNSSTKGPFYPSYMPYGWHWTHAFLERLQYGGGHGHYGSRMAPAVQNTTRRPYRNHKHVRPGGKPKQEDAESTLRLVPPGSYRPPSWPRSAPGLEPDGTWQPKGPPVIRAVGSSLVCLPESDAGGPGPRLESWALALDSVAMELVMEKEVLKVRSCKTCPDAEQGIVVGGEYGISVALLEAGYNFATLMSKYARDVDWRDPRHWGCNDNVHPSRHGTYDGIAFHPYETVFVKASWHVGDPYTRRYGTWATQHAEGDAGTDGEFNELMYNYAISSEAQQPNLLEACYDVQRVQKLLAKQREAEAEALASEQRAAGERALSHD